MEDNENKIKKFFKNLGKALIPNSSRNIFSTIADSVKDASEDKEEYSSDINYTELLKDNPNMLKTLMAGESGTIEELDETRARVSTRKTSRKTSGRVKANGTIEADKTREDE